MLRGLFGRNKGVRNVQIPNKFVHEVFGEVNVRYTGKGSKEIVATILMDPVKEGTQTGVAIDGSASMMGAFGQTFKFKRQPPNHMIQDMARKGLVRMVNLDGRTQTIWTEEAIKPLEQQGYVEYTVNEVEPMAHQVIPYLADKLDEDGGCTVIYWACGQMGDKIEIVGDLEAPQVPNTPFAGPEDWGRGTQLVPAMRYFIDRFQDAAYGFYVFITDGRLDDLSAVKKYTMDISRAVADGKRKPVKGVLIGVGSEIDQDQMEELDDLPSPYDFWDHKVASTMRDLRDIFAEVVDENMRVAEKGAVYDDQGKLAKNYSDGVPAMLTFSLPEGATSFRLELPGGEVVQSLQEEE